METGSSPALAVNEEETIPDIRPNVADMELMADIDELEQLEVCQRMPGYFEIPTALTYDEEYC